MVSEHLRIRNKSCCFLFLNVQKTHFASLEMLSGVYAGVIFLFFLISNLFLISNIFFVVCLWFGVLAFSFVCFVPLPFLFLFCLFLFPFHCS